MRIEVADHATNGALQQHGIIDGLDVVLFDAIEDLGEQAGMLQRQGLAVGRAGRTDQAPAHGQAEAQHEADNNNQNRPGFQ